MSNPSAFTQRASGILTPTATLDRQHYTMPDEDWKKLLRLRQMAEEYGLSVGLFCRTCEALVEVRHQDRLVVEREDGSEAKGGHLLLHCQCAEWSITALPRH